MLVYQRRGEPAANTRSRCQASAASGTATRGADQVMSNGENPSSEDEMDVS